MGSHFFGNAASNVGTGFTHPFNMADQGRVGGIGVNTGPQKYTGGVPQYSGVTPTLGLANQLYAQQFAPPPAPASAAPGAAPAAAPSPLPAGIFGAPAAGRAPGQAQPNGWGMPTTQPTSATAGRSIYG